MSKKTKTLLYFETLYKKTPVVEISRHTVYIQVLYMWALPFRLHSRQSVHTGTALTAILLRTGWHSPPAGTAPGSAVPGWGEYAVPGYKPLWQLHRWKSCREMLGQPKHATSPVPGSYEETVSCFSFSQFIWGSWLSGEAALPSSLSICMVSGPFQLTFHWTLSRGHVYTACFFGLGRNGKGRAVPTSFSIPLKWRQGWHCHAGQLPLG
jgi:hypothetical protein